MTYILITGSEGLIGTELCPAIEKTGVKAKHFDIKFPNNHENYGDILDIKRINEKIKDCIGIIHLAAVSRVLWGEENPDLCWETNVIGTQNVINAAQNSPLKPWILYASSREIYGQQERLPVEIDTPYAPLNIYARSKVAAEKEILEARKSHLITAVVRYSSVYGSIHDHADRVVPAFCRAAVTGEQLRIDGLKNTLDFTHVKDVIDGTLKIIQLLEKGKNSLPPVHLTTGIPTTLGELSELACKASGKKLKFVEALSRSYDVSRFWGSTVKTSQLLGWRTKISIEQGVQDLVQQFKSLLNNKT